MAKNRTVLITGAGVRLGREMSLAMAGDGWDVVLHYRNSKKQAETLAKDIRAKNRMAILAQADLGNAQDVERLIPSLNQQGITLDCLINNAAVFERGGLDDLTPEALQRHMQVNCFAPLILMRDFAAQYKGREGNIVNITDGMTGWSMSPNFLSYCLSKQALTHATQLLASELAPNIRVNAIAPGAIIEGAQDKKGAFTRLAKIIPLKRTGSPREVVDALRYVLAAPSLTGQTISLSGGLSLPKVLSDPGI